MSSLIKRAKNWDEDESVDEEVLEPEGEIIEQEEEEIRPVRKERPLSPKERIEMEMRDVRKEDLRPSALVKSKIKEPRQDIWKAVNVPIEFKSAIQNQETEEVLVTGSSDNDTSEILSRILNKLDRIEKAVIG